jgi:hypothetical protein
LDKTVLSKKCEKCPESLKSVWGFYNIPLSKNMCFLTGRRFATEASPQMVRDPKHLHRPGWILLVHDDGSPAGYLKRPPPEDPAPAKRLRAWRKANGLSQQAAAKLLRCTSAKVSACERICKTMPEDMLARLDALAGEHLSEADSRALNRATKRAKKLANTAG